MLRAHKLSSFVVAALIFAALIALAPAREASANGMMLPVDRYYVTVYYRAHASDPWHMYATYYVSVHANGMVDWGGALQAVQFIQSYGYQTFATSRYAGRTYE